MKGKLKLPLIVEWPKIGTCSPYVKDFNGRIIRWFKSSNEARKFAEKYNRHENPKH